MSRIGERILLSLCQPRSSPAEETGGIELASDRLEHFGSRFGVPIRPHLTGRVLEVGFGGAVLLAEIHALGGPPSTGIEVRDLCFDFVRQHNPGASECVLVKSGGQELPFAAESFDTLVSEDCFEHYREPDHVLLEAFRVLAPGGRFLVSYGPPWFHPRGGHMFFMGPPPWFHLLFSEASVFAVRSRFRTDGARRWDDDATGLNKLSVGRFLSLARHAGFDVEYQHRRAIKKMQFLVKLPILRECLVSFFSVVLRKPRT